MSVVYHVPTDTDDLLISTMTDRAKAHAVARDGKVGLCVPGERWPFAFLQVYADAEIERERGLAVDVRPNGCRGSDPAMKRVRL
jgi:general stress protein 26